MIYVKYLECFSLNSIGCVTKCSPAGILEEIQPTDVYEKVTCSNLHTERFGNILTAR